MSDQRADDAPPAAGGPGTLRLESVRHPTGSVVLHAIGEVDTTTAPELGAEIGAWGDTTPDVLLDLSRVTFLGSAGLSTLLETRDMLAACGGRFEIHCGDSRVVRRALQVTGTMELFDVVDRLPDDPDQRAPLFVVPDA